jgi:hypothetical protein
MWANVRIELSVMNDAAKLKPSQPLNYHCQFHDAYLTTFTRVSQLIVNRNQVAIYENEIDQIMKLACEDCKSLWKLTKRKLPL